MQKKPALRISFDEKGKVVGLGYLDYYLRNFCEFQLNPYLLGLD